MLCWNTYVSVRHGSHDASRDTSEKGRDGGEGVFTNLKQLMISSWGRAVGIYWFIQGGGYVEAVVKLTVTVRTNR